MSGEFRVADVYYLACVYAISSSKVESEGDASELSNLRRDYRERAIASLRQAIAMGFRNFAHIREDRDFEAIRDHTGFQKLLEENGVDEGPGAQADQNR